MDCKSYYNEIENAELSAVGDNEKYYITDKKFLRRI